MKYLVNKNLNRANIWQLNKLVILIILILSIIILISFLFLKVYDEYHVSQAMRCFEALENKIQRLNISSDSNFKIKEAASILYNRYGDTIYAAYGLFITAKALQIGQDPISACKQLEQIVRQPKYSLFHPIANIRLAGLFLDLGKYDNAMSYLNNPSVEFENLFSDRKGDILLAQGKKKDAKIVWQEILKNIDLNDPLLPILRIKLEALIGE